MGIKKNNGHESDVYGINRMVSQRHTQCPTGYLMSNNNVAFNGHD